MSLQLRKRTWVALAILLALLVVALWHLSSPPLPVRLTFQQATNDRANGRVGVIELVNNLREKVIIMGGWYVPAKVDDLGLSLTTPQALIYGDTQRLTLPARSTNIAQVSMPTNGGPYKLVFQCVPDSQDPSRTQGTLRHRMVFWVSSWLHPSQQRMIRWFGGFFAVSQSIDVSKRTHAAKQIDEDQPLPFDSARHKAEA